ncbi:hypothetical protein U9M48_031911 [Paspalum notatum var. saurae]|uniref:dCTP pyrophosphatase 1 n=1 Tax=Paspalum notatum var. saurae TaxID=547442 RepID=A0AAQ3U3L0_PASNO
MDGRGLQEQENEAAPAEGNRRARGDPAAAVTLEELRKRMADFARERDWEQFHSPRNLLLAMVGEVGELSEIFQWRGEVPKGLPGWEAREMEHLGEELADVLLYLVRLSDMCGVDLGRAALRKIELNAVKYPVGKRHNTSSKKFARCSGDDVGTAGGDKTVVANEDDA